MICEKCNKNHIGAYGSGRFCSQQCARSWSTQANRHARNEKIRQALSQRVTKKCEHCNNDIQSAKRAQCFCSKSCASQSRANDPAFLAKLRKPKYSSAKMGGPRPGGGRTKAILYDAPEGVIKLNAHEIRVANILNSLSVDWIRNVRGFEYVDATGKKRKYYPDFYLRDYNVYVEYKGWVTPALMHKMTTAMRDENLIIIYSDDKRYSKLGLSLTEIENNPALLYEAIGAHVPRLASETPNLAGKVRSLQHLPKM